MLSQGIVPRQRPTQNAISPSSHLQSRCSWPFYNSSALSYPILMALPSLHLVSVGGRCSQRPGPFSTIRSLGRSPTSFRCQSLCPWCFRHSSWRVVQQTPLWKILRGGNHRSTTSKTGFGTLVGKLSDNTWDGNIVEIQIGTRRNFIPPMCVCRSHLWMTLFMENNSWLDCMNCWWMWTNIWQMRMWAWPRAPMLQIIWAHFISDYCSACWFVPWFANNLDTDPHFPSIIVIHTFAILAPNYLGWQFYQILLGSRIFLLQQHIELIQVKQYATTHVIL